MRYNCEKSAVVDCTEQSKFNFWSFEIEYSKKGFINAISLLWIVSVKHGSLCQ